MAEPVDYDIDRTDVPAPYEGLPRRSRVWWIAGAVAVVLIAAAAFFFLRRDSLSGDADTSIATPVPPSPPAAGAAVEPIALPPLDQTDALVRQFVRTLSSHPRVAAWLATDDLIRNFTVVVENISNGQTPAGHLRVLRPAGPFQVSARDGRLLVDPRGYSRYNDLAGAVASIDTAGAARLYSMLKPRIQDAYAELGYQQSFDIALSRAIGTLLQAPALDGDVALEPEGAVEYRFADGRVEGLNAAQKQLVRMGPANVRVIQAKLRDIAGAIGLAIGQ